MAEWDTRHNLTIPPPQPSLRENSLLTPLTQATTYRGRVPKEWSTSKCVEWEQKTICTVWSNETTSHRYFIFTIRVCGYIGCVNHVLSIIKIEHSTSDEFHEDLFILPTTLVLCSVCMCGIESMHWIKSSQLLCVPHGISNPLVFISRILPSRDWPHADCAVCLKTTALLYIEF